MEPTIDMNKVDSWGSIFPFIWGNQPYQTRRSFYAESA